MGWIISPSEGVTNYDNGSFKLPCSESNVTYKITYVSSEGCSSNTVSYTYVTSGSCDTPACPTQSNIINTNTSVANSGGTQVAVMQILKDSTYTAYTITADSTSSSYVSNITQGAHLHDNWYVVLADVTANPGTTCRPLYFDVIAEGPTLGTGCTYNNVTVTQCPTDSEVYRLYDIEVSSLGEDGVELGCTLNNSSFTSYTFSDAGYTAMTNVGYNGNYDNAYPIFAADFEPNDSTNEKTFTIFLTGITNDGQQCKYYFNVKQKGASPTPTCGCNAITVNGTYEADPTVPTQTIQFTLKINNTTNNIVYFDEGVINFNNGVSKTINPGCEGVNGNETKTIGTFTLYNAPDPATIASATIEASHQSNCSGYAVTSVTPDITTLTNGCTLTLTYNG